MILLWTKKSKKIFLFYEERLQHAHNEGEKSSASKLQRVVSRKDKKEAQGVIKSLGDFVPVISLCALCGSLF